MAYMTPTVTSSVNMSHISSVHRHHRLQSINQNISNRSNDLMVWNVHWPSKVLSLNICSWFSWKQTPCVSVSPSPPLGLPWRWCSSVDNVGRSSSRQAARPLAGCRWFPHRSSCSSRRSEELQHPTVKSHWVRKNSDAQNCQLISDQQIVSGRQSLGILFTQRVCVMMDLK